MTDDSASINQKALPVHFSVVHERTRDLVLIPDMCDWIRNLHQTPPNSLDEGATSGFVGTPETRYSAKLPREPDSSSSVICMEDWLDQPQDCHLSRRNRLILALHLAQNIMQLFSTAWIGADWTWRDFSMGRDSPAEDPKLFVTGHFYSAEVPSPERLVPDAQFWALLREPLLVRLGFALIELALGKRLSELRSLVSSGKMKNKEAAEPRAASVVEDYDTAMKLLEKGIVRDAEGDAFHRVVKACLKCEVIMEGGAKSLTSECATFQEDMEQFVALPLRDYVENLWEAVAV